MAAEVRKFSVTIPAGTLQTNPQKTSMTFPPRIVRELEIRVPPGPRGVVGFQIAQAGAQVFPTEPGAFFVTDDEAITWPVEGANTSGAWQLIAYNSGTFNHTIEIRFLVDIPGVRSDSTTTAPLPAEVMGGSFPPIVPAPLPGGLDLGALTPLAPEIPALPAIPAISVPGLPAGSLPALPSLPGLPSLPSSLPGLVLPPAPSVSAPSGPAIPTQPGQPAPATGAVAAQGEANTQAILQGAAAQANLTAGWDSAEARTQAIAEAAAANYSALTARSGGTQIFI